MDAKERKGRRMTNAARTIAILLLAFDKAMSDRQLGRFMPHKPSTVRKARHRLELAGEITRAHHDGRAKRWRLANRPQRQLFLAPNHQETP